MTFGRTNRRVGLIILILTTIFALSCKKPIPPAPPPPPPPAPAPAPPAPSITLSAEPLTIERGQSLTLNWSATNAATVSIEPGLGTVPATGSRQVTPTSSVTYNATATGPGGTATDTARVTVNVPPPPTAPPAPTPRPTATMDELFRDNVREVLFDYDKADIRPDQVSKLQDAASWLRANQNVRFSVEGHADERGSQEYNLALGDQRASAVKQFLAQQGVAENRINTISYGEERPQCSEQSEDCFQRNRRAAFVYQQ